MRSDMSVLGLYNYDNTLFANMSYPTGFQNDDKTTFVNNLLMELAELEVLYPNPSFMKFAIANWSKKELPTWNRMYAASLLEYNPIENYDRKESSTDTTEATRQHSGTDTATNTGTDTTTNTGTDTTTNTGTDTTTNTGTDTTTNSGKDTTQMSGTDTSTASGTHSSTNSGTDTTTNKIAAFNSSTLVDHDTSALAHGHAVSESTSDNVSVTHGQKEELTHGHVEALQHGHTQALQHGHIQAMQHGEKIEDETETSRESRIHGNIGVTTSQQMLEQEIEVAPKLNIINLMIESFKNRFCIMVW